MVVLSMLWSVSYKKNLKKHFKFTFFFEKLQRHALSLPVTVGDETWRLSGDVLMADVLDEKRAVRYSKKKN